VPLSSEPDHAADDLAAIHGGEGFVDLVQADLTGDEAGQIEQAGLPEREDAVEVRADIGGALEAPHQPAFAGVQFGGAEGDQVGGASRADRDRYPAPPGGVPGLAQGRGMSHHLENVIKSGARGQAPGSRRLRSSEMTSGSPTARRTAPRT